MRFLVLDFNARTVEMMPTDNRTCLTTQMAIWNLLRILQVNFGGMSEAIAKKLSSFIKLQEPQLRIYIYIYREIDMYRINLAILKQKIGESKLKPPAHFSSSVKNKASLPVCDQNMCRESKEKHQSIWETEMKLPKNQMKERR